MASPDNNTNSLDDIFGSSPPHETTPHTTLHEPPTTTATTAEPSELPSLRRQHVTAGYRDGVSASKGEHVQAGFDAGFPVGAQLGMRAGTALGILEGILRGYESRAVVKKQPHRAGHASASATGAATSTSTTTETATAEGGDVTERQAKKEEILKLYRRAVADLDLQTVFAGLHGDEGEKPEVRLERTGDVAVSKWEKRVRIAHWEENMEVLEMKDGGLNGGDKDVPGRS